MKKSSSQSLIEILQKSCIETNNGDAGRLIFDSGFDQVGGETEIKFAKWLITTFGGDVTLITKSERQGVLSADYLWQNKLWDLKTPKSTKVSTLEKRIRHGLKQISPNPGGLMIDLSDNALDITSGTKVISKLIMQNAHWTTIVIVKKGSEYRICRIKK